ncbi:hypothetical protein GCM10011511_28490 [Puia dinghuensis]|uniref:Uncharacterized protein n=2 Tax=Puia dinghuensis TaxID=1792502 RepID=A0A8J2UDQ2_9BACT|nr:hypothetical protein GCM10011511_28490 [Puia dinghuensis]
MGSLINDLLLLKDLLQRHGLDYDQFVAHNYTRLQSQVDAWWADHFAQHGYTPEAAAEAEYLNAELGLQSLDASPFFADHVYWLSMAPTTD